MFFNELDSVSRNFRLTATDGKNYQVVHYNLDAIIPIQKTKSFDSL